MKIDNTDFLFVGGVFPEEYELEVVKKSKHGLQMAANNFQWSLIRGFDSNLCKPVTIINQMFIGSFPKNYSDIFISGNSFSHVSNAKDYNLSFINLTILKHFINPFGQKKLLKGWVNNTIKNNKIAFIYSLSPNSIRIAKFLKKINPEVFVCVSVHDLPEYIMLGKRADNWVVKAWKFISENKVNKGLKYIDGFMLVTEKMVDKLGVNNKPYVVIEALIEINNRIPLIKETENEDIIRIVYTGGLFEKYGILNLLQAFGQIKSEKYRLIICGDGECKKDIIDIALKDKRIEYLGLVSYNEIQKIQQSATVLINPRQNIFDFTQYSFPIKTIEYLLSGKPVISYKLSGIPDEYDDYLIYIENDSIEMLRDKIIEVCSMSKNELENIGNKNRDFVLKQKNHIVQTEKILKMINNNNN